MLASAVLAGAVVVTAVIALAGTRSAADSRHEPVRTMPRQTSTSAPASRLPNSTADASASRATYVPPAPVLPTKPRRPAPDPCAGNQGREVLVSLASQHVWLCQGRTVHADFPVTTGRTSDGDATPVGTFAVQALTRDTTLRPASGSAYPVKYWIPFKWGVFGFHDAPWQTIPFGSQRYKTAGSQGCVHMRTRDIERLFTWAQLGTRVKVVAHVSGT